jgi:hypothetical protein
MVDENLEMIAIYTVGALCAIPAGLAINYAVGSPYALVMTLCDLGDEGEFSFRDSFSRHLDHYMQGGIREE